MDNAILLFVLTQAIASNRVCFLHVGGVYQYACTVTCVAELDQSGTIRECLQGSCGGQVDVFFQGAVVQKLVNAVNCSTTQHLFPKLSLHLDAFQHLFGYLVVYERSEYSCQRSREFIL